MVDYPLAFFAWAAIAAVVIVAMAWQLNKWTKTHGR